MAVLFTFILMSIGAQAKELKLKAESVDLKNISQITASKLFEPQGGVQPEDLVIQFKTAVTEQVKKELNDLGFSVLQYLPDDALIVRGSLKAAAKLLKTRNDIYEVAPYLANWKLSQDFSSLSVFDQQYEVVIQVRLLPRSDAKIVSEKMKTLGLVVLSAEGREIILKAPRLKALDISNLDGIEFIQVLPEISTFVLQSAVGPKDESLGETKTGYESGTKVMNFDQAWARGFSGYGQTVAMTDTGLDSGSVSDLHPDLTTVIGGEALGLFSFSWTDPQGHGTHVTGSVVGQGTKSNGLIKGGAFGASFYAQGMWSPFTHNISVPSDLGKMFQSAYNHGARIHTNSWGSVRNFGTYDAMSAAVDEFMFYHPDMLILFAAGNSGSDLDADGVIDAQSVSSPGTAKNTLTVGASENYMVEGGRLKTCGSMGKKWGVSPLKEDMLSDSPDGIACFSSRGPTLDKRIKPDIVAPGTNIVSLRSKNSSATRLWGIYNEDYSWAGGTSMATPLTAGAAAVTRQYLVTQGMINPSAALVKATLLHSATDLFPGQFGLGATQEIATPRPNSVEGYGRVNMDVATNLGASQIYDEKIGLATEESRSFTVNIDSASKVSGLRATLVYTDAPAAVSAAQALVNDLDLAITSEDGKKYTLNDSTNNAEMLELKGLSAGKYTVTVTGRNIPQGLNGRQPYAILISPLVGAL